MADEDIRVPAGWYPDPLGLPQLRWWDTRAWTEHTTESRGPAGESDVNTSPAGAPGGFASATQTTIPTVVKSTRLSFADPFEDYEDSYETEPDDVDEEDSSTAYGRPLLELEGLAAPDADEVDARTAPAQRFGAAPAGAPTGPSYTLDQRFDDLIGGVTTTEIIEEPSGPPLRLPHHSSGEQTRTRRRGGASLPADWTPPEHAHTGAVWAIALMPLAMLLPGLLFLLSGLAGEGSSTFFGLVLLVPYVVTAWLAFRDSTRLRELGFQRPAHWTWALLTAPVYLIARSRAASSELTGRGSAPLTTWTAMALVTVLSGVIAPGLILALSPQVFSEQAAQSIEDQAAQFGIPINVTCPPTPPLLPGQSFVCLAREGSGESVALTVTLERDLGWITWRVSDWGGMR